MKYIKKFNKDFSTIEKKDFIEEILKMKGIQDPQHFLSPTSRDYLNPLALDNIERATEILFKHLTLKHKIFIQVDADTDGYCSAAIMYLYLKQMDKDANVVWRVHEGKQHGIIVDTVPEDVDLVIIPDAGSNQYEAHAQLRNKGKDVIVIDHHEADHESVDALVINNQLSVNFTNKDLSGAGVVFKFCQYLDKIQGTQWADKFLDLTAVAIIGDMMLLNRVETHLIIEKGLSNITNVGLKSLIEKQAFSMGNKVTPTTVAFYVVPLINAVIRVGKKEEKELLFKAFIEGETVVDSTKRGAKAGETETIAEQAARICTNAKNRQQKTRDLAIENIIREIEENGYDDHKILIVPIDDENEVNPALTGLVAMQICSRYKKPAMIIRLAPDGFYRGSARGINNSELKDLRQFCNDSGFFEYAEGHANANGVSIKGENIKPFLQYADEELKDINFNEGSYEVDFVLTNNDNYASDLILAIGQLQNVWGQGIEEPKLIFEKIIINQKNIQIMGKDKTSIKISSNGIDFIRFKDPELISKVINGNEFEMTILGKANVNEWNGYITPQIFIDDYDIKECTFEF